MPNDTALHKACHGGELDTAKKLIEGGEYGVNERACVVCAVQRPNPHTVPTDTDFTPRPPFLSIFPLQPAQATGGRCTARRAAITSRSAAT